MNETFIKNVVEAAMLAAGRSLQVAELAELFDELNRPAIADIRAALASLEQDYTGRGIEVKETATGFRIQVRRDLANEVSRLWPERPPKYSRALLETLALIAYRQPITRAEIEAVRGVAVNPNIIKTLLERSWVRVVGNRDVPGRPELLGTTKDFLDYFGLVSLGDLPPLAELKAMGDVNLQLDLAKDGVAAGVPALGADGADGTAGDAVAAVPDEAAVTEGVGGDAGAAADVGAVANADVDAIGAGVDTIGDAVASADGDADASAEGDGDAVAVVARDDADAVAELDAGVAELLEGEATESEPAGPAARAAESFVAEMDSDDADASGSDDDSGDEDELSAADSQGKSELVAAPPSYDD